MPVLTLMLLVLLNKRDATSGVAAPIEEAEEASKEAVGILLSLKLLCSPRSPVSFSPLSALSFSILDI